MRALSLASTVCGALLALPTIAQDASRPLRVYGNTSTLELAPVLLAAERQQPGPIPVTNGGIPNLFTPGEADVATNAETQALRQSVDHPDLRIILTVSEGFYRVVARRSAGITKLADLRGKKIGTVPRTSSAYYLARMLATAGLKESDVTIVTLVPLTKVPAALKSGEVDAVTVWEPEIQTAQNLLGADAIEFQDRTVYRELFNLNTTAAALADPVRRKQIVAFVRSIIRESAQIRRDPREARAALVKTTGFDEKLIEQVWHHEGYPGTLVPDLLDVLVQEEPWVAKERNRTPRTRAELAKLIDESVYKEALAQERADPAPATSSLETRVQRLEDVEAIRRLLREYGRRLDAGDLRGYAELFAIDGEWIGGFGPVKGRANIAPFMEERMRTPSAAVEGKAAASAPPRPGPRGVHLMTNEIIEVNGDRATAWSKWTYMSRSVDNKPTPVLVGHYDDTLVRENGEWKILKRLVSGEIPYAEPPAAK